MDETSVEIIFIISNDTNFKEDAVGEYLISKATSLFVEEEMEKAIEILKPKQKLLKLMKNRYNLQYYINIRINVKNGELPSIYFENDIFNFLNDIGIELHIVL